MRTLVGTVVSNRMIQTVVVRVDRLHSVAKYRKFVRVSSKYAVHVKAGEAYRVGDIVEIGETKPISRTKRWQVLRVVKAAPAAMVLEDLPAESAEISQP